MFTEMQYIIQTKEKKKVIIHNVFGKRNLLFI